MGDAYYTAGWGPALYDRYFVHGRASAEQLVAAVGPLVRPGARVLDVGTGTGAVALAAAALVPAGEVIGVDADAAGLELARHKAARAGLRNVAFRTGDALRLDFPDGAFDAVLANQVPLDREPAALAERVRVLRPGGVLAVGRPYAAGAAVEFHRELLTAVASRQGRPAPALAAQSDPAAVEGLLRGAGLTVLSVEARPHLVADGSFEAFLLGNVAQLGGHWLVALVAWALGTTPEDTPAMVRGYLDFVEVGRRLFDERYGGRLNGASVVGIGRKPA